MSAPHAPLVSIIIPCYNQAQFLTESIESVLNQSCQNFEIIVVDDGSTDQTSAVAARYREVRCLRQKNYGLSAARNAGLQASRGSFVIFLDADDRLLPDAIETGLKKLDEFPECAFTYGHAKSIAADGSPIASRQRPCVEKDHYLHLLRDNYIYNPAMVMYRRAVFDSIGGFDPAVNPAADYDLYLRIARKFRIRCHDKAVVEYRQHGANMSGNAALMLRHTLSVLGGQRKYVSGYKKFRQAYRSGMKHWRYFYGEHLVNEVRAYVRAGQWRQAARGMRTLLKFHPQAFFKHGLRKLYSVVLSMKY